MPSRIVYRLAPGEDPRPGAYTLTDDGDVRVFCPRCARPARLRATAFDADGESVVVVPCAGTCGHAARLRLDPPLGAGPSSVVGPAARSPPPEPGRARRGGSTPGGRVGVAGDA